MSASQNLFGKIYGDLPLLHLNTRAILKLPPDNRKAFRVQLTHNCIRQAWLDARFNRASVRDALNIRMARAEATLVSVLHGGPVHEFGLVLAMDRARTTNERETCFGFFLLDEIRHLVDRRAPGPILRSTFSANSSFQVQEHGAFDPRYITRLQACLDQYRDHVQSSKVALQTVDLVSQITGRDSCMESLPDEAKGYFLMAEALFEGLELGSDLTLEPTSNEAECNDYQSWKVKET